MSTNVLSVIPADPFWTPGAAAAGAARAVLALVYPGAREVAMDWHEDPVFVDPGENFEGVRCPGCAGELAIEWWQERMDEAYATNFRALGVRPSCCGRESDLNRLVYDQPAGFARFVLFATEPARAGTGDPLVVDASALRDGELAMIAAALGHPVRQVVARY
ncbi:hypothetical protein [Actinoplanes aureus]|uniref:Uncharacterized protein n=1 Tax=Actinoplanes aureus TaxID=2792083 RepID=A0A931CCB0_9ACTN|nr:hypothetical protein [Actinoplanes aureus]MBG0563966.1 hypothetical protein [Actinoplanes aureus]